MFEYLSNNFFEISKLFLQHLFLVMLSLVIALVISLPSGYLLSGNKRVESFIIPFFGIIYTIPSLALFAIFIPLMGLGLKSAILALVLYNLFIYHYICMLELKIQKLFFNNNRLKNVFQKKYY